LRGGDDEFRLDLDFKHIFAHELQQPGHPSIKQLLHVQKHLGLFPTDRAILTTGGAITARVGQGDCLRSG
jgi:type II secretory pathway component PulM